MQIQAICANGIALLTNLEELNSRGIQAQTINSQNTADMIRQSFAELGIDADGAIDVETYINGQAVLIFAHVFKTAESIAALFKFEDFEDLISAVWQLCDKLPATLIAGKHCYYLAIHSHDGKIPEDFLSEYGCIEENARLRYAHLCEHGKILCHGNAIRTIRQSFHPNHSGNSYFADSLTATD